jgi:ankyrin repeat protein
VAAHQGHSLLIHALGKMKHVELNAVDNNGRTALHYAAAKGHNAVVSDLWTLGCNLELTDNVGWTGELPYLLPFTFKIGKVRFF